MKKKKKKNDDDCFWFIFPWPSRQKCTVSPCRVAQKVSIRKANFVKSSVSFLALPWKLKWSEVICVCEAVTGLRDKRDSERKRPTRLLTTEEWSVTLRPGSLRTGNEDGRGTETLARTVLIHGKFHRCLPLVLIALQNKVLSWQCAGPGMAGYAGRGVCARTQPMLGNLGQRSLRTYFFGMKAEKQTV